MVGGGNILRGVEVSERGVPRPVGDTMGMLATVMNCLVLEAAIERAGRERAHAVGARHAAGLRDLRSPARACRISTKGRIVSSRRHRQSVLSPPTPPLCCARPRSGCQAVLKATNVDGVYTADPKKDPKAKRYDKLEPPGSDREGPEGHGWHRLRACPGKPYAYHRILDRLSKGAIEAVLRGKGRCDYRRR